MRTSAMFWGIFWRSVFWYTLAGAVLGALYGCALLASQVVALAPAEGWEKRSLAALVVLGSVAGAVLGWWAARGTRMRPLLGAMFGALAGAPCGGLYLAFGYVFAIPIGGVLGAAYGLILGIMNGVVTAAVTRTWHLPLMHVSQYRHAAGRIGPVLVGALAVLACLVAVAEGTTTAVGYGLVFILFPCLILLPTAEWIGECLADWYTGELGFSPSGDLVRKWKLEKAVETRLVIWGRDPRVWLAACGVVTTLLLVVATLSGIEKRQNRHEQIPAPGYAQASEVQLSPDGERLAIQSRYEGFRIWSVGERRWADTAPVAFSEVWKMSPDGRLLADSCPENVLLPCGRVLRADDGSEVAKLPNRGLYAFSWSASSSMLAGAGGDEVWIWRVRDGAILHTLKGALIGVQEPQFSPNNRILATNGESNDPVILWSLEDGQRIRTLLAPSDLGPGDHDSYGAEMAFSPDGEVFAKSGGGGRATLWRVSDGRILQVLGNQHAASALAFSPDGSKLVTGSDEGGLTLWRVADGAKLRDYAGHVHPVYQVAFSPDGNKIASYGVDNKVRLWPVEEDALDE